VGARHAVPTPRYLGATELQIQMTTGLRQHGGAYHASRTRVAKWDC
jgi:hypothetical protein